MSRSQVKDLQNSLIKAGYSVGKSGADGIWGKDTAAAVSAWKKSTGNNNTYGNTIGASNLAKIGSAGTKGTTTKTPANTNRNAGVKTALGGSNLLGTSTIGKAARTFINNNPNSSPNAYLRALQSGLIEPLGSSNLTVDPNIKSQWNTALADANTLYNTNAGQLGNVYNQGVNQANLMSDEAARQQYIAYMQNRKNLAEQLSTNGITGGASETALNQILNSYSSNLADTEASRQSALAELANEYNGNLSDLMAQLQSNQASINSQYGAMAQEDLANQKQNLLNGQISTLQAYINRQNELKEQNQAAKSQNAINSWNTKIQSKINAKNPKYTYVTSDGRLHYTNSQATANAAKALGAKVVERKDPKTTTKKSSSSKKTTKSSGSKTTSSSLAKTIAAVWGNSSSDNKTTSKKTNRTPKYSKANGYTYTSVKKR
nr:MAG TPA: nuclear pore complex protein [Caudoviricetes sp.]